MRNYWSKSVTLVGIAIQIVILAVVALFIGVWVSMPARTLDAPLLGFAWMVARAPSPASRGRGTQLVRVHRLGSLCAVCAHSLPSPPAPLPRCGRGV